MNIHIIVPDITLTAYPNPVDEGKNVTLTCRVTSDQIPGPFHIDIIRMGDRSEENDRPLSHINDGLGLTHRLDRVSPSDAGTYRCEVGHTTGANLSLSVNYAPKFFAMKDKHVVAKGDPSAFLVSVTAYPLPVEFSWSKDGGRVPNTAIITYDELQTTLSFPAVTETDYGLYDITATTSKGSSSAIIQLAAESAPERPYNLTVTRKNSHRYVTLEWTAGFNGGLDTTHTVQYRKVDGEWVDLDGHLVTEPANSNHPQYTNMIFQLPKKGKYNIRIRAANKIQPAASSNVISVTIEDAATLYGRLPITNWDYSDYLQNLSSPSAVQLCTEVRSELGKVFHAIIGYEKSECDHFREIGGSFA
ncbi:cell adhesion molecule 2-like [Branchiostoma lanceolatum]|uniref:cell adhesion molecule 2-like n=1 Tax=Branchiostoma lanceolatum TaxID=7740 RepID=UPI003456FC86